MKENYQKPLSKLLLVPLARVGHMLMPLAILCKGAAVITDFTPWGQER